MRRLIALLLTTVSITGLAIAAVVDFGALFGPYGLVVASAAVVGAIVVWRVDEHPIGWLLLSLAVSTGAGLGVRSMVGVVESSPAAGWADAIGNALATAGILIVPVTLLRFPDGKLLSRRWSPVEWMIVVTGVLGAAAALLNGGWGGDTGQAVAISPLHDATAPAGDIVSNIFYPLMGGSLVVAGISIILRYRRSRGEGRLQVKWLAYSGALLLSTFLIMSVVSGNVSADEGWQEILVAAVLASVPVAMGIAVLEYHLYDIDIVINRTVVLALLAGFITAIYATIVVFVGELVGRETGGLLLPIAATAVVALAFEPVRHTAQGWANRLVYGRRATPYEVLSDLTERLSRGEHIQGLLERMASRLGDGTGAERATIWLGAAGDMTVGASRPEAPDASPGPDLASDNVFAVTHDGLVVGALEVVKPRGSGLSSAEKALISDLAGSAGAILGYRRLNDSLEAKARELAESRARLVGAQDRERQRLERDLHDGAQQLIVALKVKIGLARAMAARHDATDLADLLAGLGEEAQRALEDVRSLAKGIYPPVLESDGLRSAISALASGATEEVVVRCDGIGRYPRDLEAAVYFEVSEAMTNAVKHASGPIRVELSEDDGSVAFSVSDSGPGFDPALANGGSGLQNLRDRVDAMGGSLEIVSDPRGTTVRGTVPLESARV